MIRRLTISGNDDLWGLVLYGSIKTLRLNPKLQPIFEKVEEQTVATGEALRQCVAMLVVHRTKNQRVTER